MAEFFKTFMLTLMSEECYDNYFLDFNLLDGNITNIDI